MTTPIEKVNGLLDSEDRQSLVIIHHEDAIAFGRKTRGYGAGKLVLPGGKDRYQVSSSGIALVPGIYEAVREVREELGLQIDHSTLSQVGLLCVSTEDDNKDVAIFEGYSHEASLSGSDELMNIDWYPKSALPYAEMPEDYRLWLPHILAGYTVTAFLETENEKLIASNIFRQHIDPLDRLQQLPV